MKSRNYEFRPLGLLELIDEGFQVYRAHFKTLFLIAAIPYVLFGAMNGVGTALMGVGDGDPLEPSAAMAGLGLAIVGGLAQALGQWIATAAIALAVSEAVLGRPFTVGSSYGRVGERIGGFILLLVLLVLAYLVGLLACIIGVIPAAILTSLAVAVFIIERQTASEAMYRSFNMVKADFWRAAGLVILMGLISTTLVGGVSTVVGVATVLVPAMTDPSDSLYFGLSVASSLATNVVAAFVAPLTTAVTTLYYYDLRVRTEAFDLYRLEETLYGYSESRERAGSE